MNEEVGRAPRAERFRSAMAAFIEGRRDAKLKGNEEDAAGASKYDTATWLADAARRVSQIQAVTHVLKATHPDARGSSLHCAPERLAQHAEIGTHLLGKAYAEDVVGNAAALDVFKFLKLEVDGRRLLDWMQDGDEDLRDALNADSTVATEWMKAFGGLVRTDATPTSHEAAKQVYWLVGEEPTDDASYHLLQPMFSSSLAHVVHADIEDAWFGEANKLARQAFRDKKPFEGLYRDYRDLTVRKLGGTKPQNISQLNSERRGNNYLLSSLPPRWRQVEFRSLNVSADLWSRFGHFGQVGPLTSELIRFLLSDPKPTHGTRITREGIEQALGAQLARFAETARDLLEPGWTRSSACELTLDEKLWLDPGRLELSHRSDTPQHEADDVAFEAAYHWGDWPDQVAGRFSNWLNDRLRDAGLKAVGDSEYTHWARQAIVEAAWPVPMQRRAPAGGRA